MKTAAQIAQDCVSNQIGESQIEFEIQEYARSVAEHALRDASENATACIYAEGEEPEAWINKESILKIEIKTP